MAITFGAAGTLGAASTGTSITPALPASVTAGQLLLAFVQSKNNGTHTWPAGWNKLTQVNSGTSLTVSLGWRVATGTDSAPAVTWTGSVANSAQCIRYTGARTINPLGASASGTGTTTPHTCAAVVSTFPNSVVIYWDVTNANTALTNPAGFTNRVTNGSATSVTHTDVGDETLAAVGTSSGAISAVGAAAAFVLFQVEILAPGSPWVDMPSQTYPLPIRLRIDASGAVSRQDLIEDGILAKLIIPFKGLNLTNTPEHLPKPRALRREGTRFKQSFGVPVAFGAMLLENTEPLLRYNRQSPRAASLVMGDDADGIDAKFIPPVTQAPTLGYESLPVPYRNRIRIHVLEVGDAGIEGTLQPAPPTPVSFEDMEQRHYTRAGALMLVDGGILAPFVPPATQTVSWGYEQFQTLTRKRRLLSTINVWPETPLGLFTPVGWEVQAVQPQHPRRERAGSIQFGELGIEAQFTPTAPAPPTWAYDQSFTFRRTTPPKELTVGDLGIEARFITPPVVWGYEPILIHRRQPPKESLLDVGDQGTEAQFVPPVANTFPTGWDSPSTYYRTLRRGPAAIANGDDADGIDFGMPPFSAYGWAVQTLQPQHPRPEKAGAIQFGELGIEAKFVFTPPTTVPFGYDRSLEMLRRKPRFEGLKFKQTFGVPPFFPAPPPIGYEAPPVYYHIGKARIEGILEDGDPGIQDRLQPPGGTPITRGGMAARQYTKAGATVRLDDGALAKFTFVPPVIVYVAEQGPMVRTRRRQVAAALTNGDDAEGTDAQLPAQFSTPGWEIQAVQPPHPRREKSGSVQFGELGIEAQFVFVAPIVTWGFDPWPPYYRRPKLVSALTYREEGIEAPLPSTPFAEGWAVQPWQPPHPRPEKVASTIHLDQGGMSQFVPPPAPVTWGYAQPDLNPRKTTYRSAALFPKEDGSEARFIVPFAEGWAVQPYQPPKWRPYRSAGFMFGEQGNEAQYIIFRPDGWEVQSYQPQHIKLERSGAVMFGDSGIQLRFIPPQFGFIGLDDSPGVLQPSIKTEGLSIPTLSVEGLSQPSITNEVLEMVNSIQLFTNGAITVAQGIVLSGSTPQYTGQFVDANGNSIPLGSITAVKLTICATVSRAVIVPTVSILNAGRGLVSVNGFLTLTLLPTDTAKLRQSTQELRSLVIEWDYGAGLVGKHEIQFPIQGSSPG